MAKTKNKETISKKIKYANRIVLDFSEEEMEQIKDIMQKEHLPYKKTMVYVMVKRYMEEYEQTH